MGLLCFFVPYQYLIVSVFNVILVNHCIAFEGGSSLSYYVHAIHFWNDAYRSATNAYLG